MTQDYSLSDNGERQIFASGMIREPQNDRLRYDLALDGPLFWALFKGTKFEPLTRVAKMWYENNTLDLAAKIVLELTALEGGLFPLIDRYTKLMMRGAEKYTERNWLKATGEEEYKRFVSSFCRHLKQYLNNETDEDHAAAIIFNLNGAMYVFNHRETIWQQGSLPF